MVLRLADCRYLHGSETPRCTSRVDKHFVGYSSLQFIVRGSIELSYNAHRHLLTGRWVFPCDPGPHIRFHPAPGCRDWHHRYVAVSGPLLAHWRREGLWPDGPEAVPDDLALESRFDEMLRLFRSGEHLAGANALEGVLLALAGRRARRDGPAWLAEAKELLAAPDDFRTGIAGLAADHGLSPSAFRRAFRAASGLSPREWAIHARLEKARDLLADTRLSVGEIAERLGYRDVHFFSRQFARHTGLPPLAWRKSRI